MNIRRKDYRRPIHRVRGESRESVCGLLWLDNAKETTEEVTCKHCLRMTCGNEVESDIVL